MLEINLAPIEELENKYWYVPDVATVLLLFLISWLGVQSYLNGMREETDSENQQKEEFIQNLSKLTPDLKRYDDLSKMIHDVDEKIKSVKYITASSVDRYLPVLLLEYLQNLKPEGVWFTELSQNYEKSVIELTGGALDNLLIAEFMSSLDSTRYHEPDKLDVRSLLYFPKVRLEHVSSGKKEVSQAKSLKESQTQKSFDSVQDQNIQQTDIKMESQSGSKFFREVEKFPAFQMKIRYAEK